MKFRTAIVLAALASIIVFNPASAAQVSVGRVSIDELEKACKAVGGTFWSDLNGYSCLKANCDGKGHNCVVACPAGGGACTGHVPKTRKAPNGLKGVLAPPVTNLQ